MEIEIVRLITECVVKVTALVVLIVFMKLILKFFIDYIEMTAKKPTVFEKIFGSKGDE